MEIFSLSYLSPILPEIFLIVSALILLVVGVLNSNGNGAMLSLIHI